MSPHTQQYVRKKQQQAAKHAEQDDPNVSPPPPTTTSTTTTHLPGAIPPPVGAPSSGTSARPSPLSQQEQQHLSLAAETEHAKADRLWNMYLEQDNSPITHLFGGQLQSSVVCHKCHTRFTMYEPFWDLSLPLGKEGKSGGGFNWFQAKPPSTIADCLAAFTADELLQGNEAFFCDKCNERCAATKRMRVHRLPAVLVLHIKRFKYKGTSREKLNANVAFPLRDLQLGQFMSDEAIGMCVVVGVGDGIGKQGGGGGEMWGGGGRGGWGEVVE